MFTFWETKKNYLRHNIYVYYYNIVWFFFFFVFVQTYENVYKHAKIHKQNSFAIDVTLIAIVKSITQTTMWEDWMNEYYYKNEKTKHMKRRRSLIRHLINVLSLSYLYAPQVSQRIFRYRTACVYSFCMFNIVCHKMSSVWSQSMLLRKIYIDIYGESSKCREY